MLNKYFIVLSFLLCVIVSLFCVYQYALNIKPTINQFGFVTQDLRHTTVTEVVPPKASEEIIFVGDILLARHVEYLMGLYGEHYPFKQITSFLHSTPVVVGNFESAILKQHVRTPAYVTTFSVDSKYLSALKAANFSHFSLANNHSLDYGTETFAYTRKTLEESNFTHFGHPQKADEASVTTFISGDYTISIIALNKIFANPLWDDVRRTIENMSTTSDYQIAYIHWGEEYMLKHNQVQEEYAKKLIDAGIDSVIGHHPHVTQDIQLYNGKPIFYSLGNFLFDQYFSVDVQQGLVLKLKLSSTTVQYDLVPVSSEGTLSQPYLMPESQAKLFLKNLSRRSDPSILENVLQGKLILPL